MDDMLQKASGTQFKLEVITANERAVHFYQKHQFDIINELYFLDGPLGEASEIVIEQPEMEAENDLLTPWQNQPRFKKRRNGKSVHFGRRKGQFSPSLCIIRSRH
ncbi:hypothetical protein MAQA_02677 [Listeria aquatica FSL S10-1188]|uniref:Uncharacterized protein n=2 Tax=Listeria aquatica TaxID=1494960 RepID=W7B6M6_9LIST|nr:hypothetical protein MAQA_02677 [Listeria aquatica FSL S10-1188]